MDVQKQLDRDNYCFNHKGMRGKTTKTMLPDRKPTDFQRMYHVTSTRLFTDDTSELLNA